MDPPSSLTKANGGGGDSGGDDGGGDGGPRCCSRYHLVW